MKLLQGGGISGVLRAFAISLETFFFNASTFCSSVFLHFLANVTVLAPLLPRD